MREKYQRNLELYLKWKFGNYTIRSLARMFKITHPRVLSIIKKTNQDFQRIEKEKKERTIIKGSHKKVADAIAKEIIKRKIKCEACGQIKPLVAHHKDYSRPLDIVWLCKSCHMKEHRN